MTHGAIGVSRKMGEGSYRGLLVGCMKHAISGLQGYRPKGSSFVSECVSRKSEGL